MYTRRSGVGAESEGFSQSVALFARGNLLIWLCSCGICFFLRKSSGVFLFNRLREASSF